MTDPTTDPTTEPALEATDAAQVAAPVRKAPPRQHHSLFSRLQRGEVDVDFISRSKLWYSISAIIILISIVSLIIRGFSLGIEFKGGDTWQFKSNGHTTADAQRVLNDHGIGDTTVQKVGESQLRIQTPPLTDAVQSQVSKDLEKTFGVKAADLNPSSVGSSWGRSITVKAIQGLIIFLIAVILYISFRFEFKMAVAAIVALLHDLVITAGIYSLVGFEVTPATVIAVLTILGFSLYDTVVVFDKVRENTARLGSTSSVTYSEATNAAVNQTLMRSINTSLIALMPVAALLFIGAGILGAGTLKDLALAQFVGLAAGAYSSIFIASPLLANMKEREPRYRALAAKITRQREARAHQAGRVPAVAAAGVAPASAEATIVESSSGGSATSGGSGGSGGSGAGGAARRGPARPQGRRPAARKSSGGRPSKKRRR
jgi:preprotein translocase subunit SecF